MKWLRLRTWPDGSWTDTFIRLDSVLYVHTVPVTISPGKIGRQTEIVLVGDIRLYTNEPAETLLARIHT